MFNNQSSVWDLVGVCLLFCLKISVNHLDSRIILDELYQCGVSKVSVGKMA